MDEAMEGRARRHKKANAWMDMDGTMGRRYTQNTWAEPLYENEDEDTHKHTEKHTNAQRTLALLLASGA